MNRIHFSFNCFKMVSMTLVLLAQIPSATAQESDCWGDFFDGANYKGKHFLLQGPAKLAELSDVNGENWELRIASLKTGPKASVTLYESRNFKLKATDQPMPPSEMRAWGITEKDIKEDSELIFNGNALIHDLSDFNFHQKIKSLKLECH